MIRKQVFIGIGAVVLVGLGWARLRVETPKYEVAYRGNGTPLSQFKPTSDDSAPAPKKKEKGRSIASAPEVLVDERIKVLEIKQGEIATLDRSIDVDTLVINGELHCQTLESTAVPAPIEVKAQVIHVNGVLQCGTQESPYRGKITFSLKAGNVDPETSPAYRGFLVNPGGRLVLTSPKKKSGWVKLDRTVEPGETQLVLSESVDGALARGKPARLWEVGDVIALAPTSYESAEAESFTVTSVQGNTIGLNAPVQFRHWGEVQTIRVPNRMRKFYEFTEPSEKVVTLDQRAEVANLTRGILLRADESVTPISDADAPGAELGGHMMVMAGGASYIDGVEFYRMGQAGILGRYPFHWHIAGNVQGQFIKNSSVHRSFQRCITVHRTDFAVVDNNTCYDFKGHGFFLEDGTEKNNQITNNLGMKAKYPYRSKTLLSTDMTITGSSPMGEYQGRFPNVSVFWLSHPYNDVRGNIAAGSVGSGFWMGFHNSVTDNDGTVLHPSTTNTLRFSDNLSHSSLVGFTWDGGPNGPLSGNPVNPTDHSPTGTVYEPPVKPTFSRLTAFKNSYTGIYFKGVGGLFDETLTADNGWHYWVSFNQSVRNSVMVGRSENHSNYDQNLLDTNLGKPYVQVTSRRTQQAGIALYDGPFELDGIDFLNYPSELSFRASDGKEITPVPVGIAGGTEAFMNVSRRVRFYPEPVLKIAVPDYTNAALLRDLDGSFAGRNYGAVLVGRRSLGILPASNCQTGSSVYRNMAICPPEYRETSFNIFDGEYVLGPTGQHYSLGIWGQPFVAQREDGAVTNALAQWPNIFLYGQPWTGNGTKFGMPSTTGQTIDLMLKRFRPSIWVNSEIAYPFVPVTHLIAQGRNCRLVPKNAGGTPAIVESSIAALRSSPDSAYFTSGDNLYVRLLPSRPAFGPTGLGLAHAYRSESYIVECDSPVDAVVKGEIESVRTQGFGPNRSVVVKGWACNFNYGTKIGVRLSVRSKQNRVPLETVLQTATANLATDPAISFKCGTGMTAFGFEFTLPPALVQKHVGKFISVTGDSAVSGQSDECLAGSGTFKVPAPIGPAPVLPGPVKSR